MESVMEGALLRYRIMSFVTGTALILLFAVAIPLTVDHHPLFGKVLGVGHGVFLYPLYLLTVIQLALLTRLRWWWWLLMALAGFIPFLAFVMERVVTRAIREGDRTAPTERGRLA
jgi:integral membrane protein